MVKQMRKTRTGTVVRTRNDKTSIVEMVWKQRHRLYRKQMRRVARFYVHDPLSQCQVGDVVQIEETRPVSKTKHWRLISILESHQVAEVTPMELEADAELLVAEDSPTDSPQESAEDSVEDDTQPDSDDLAAEEYTEDPEDSSEEDSAEDQDPEESESQGDEAEEPAGGEPDEQEEEAQ